MGIKKFKITPAHEKFCSMYADTGNATGSYLYAFSGVTYGSARELGSKLLTNIDIKNLIDIYKEENKIKYDFDKEKTERDLIQTAEEAKRLGQFQAYAKLREMVIKIRGYYAKNEIDITSNGEKISINLNLNDDPND